MDLEYILFVLEKNKPQISNLPTSPSLRGASKSQNFKIVIADIRWHSLEEQLLFPQIIWEQRLDLMHFPYFSVPLLYNQPFVVTIHDLIINHFPTGKASPAAFSLEIYVLIGNQRTAIQRCPMVRAAHRLAVHQKIAALFAGTHQQIPALIGKYNRRGVHVEIALGQPGVVGRSVVVLECQRVVIRRVSLHGGR